MTVSSIFLQDADMVCGGRGLDYFPILADQIVDLAFLLRWLSIVYVLIVIYINSLYTTNTDNAYAVGGHFDGIKSTGMSKKLSLVLVSEKIRSIRLNRATAKYSLDGEANIDYNVESDVRPIDAAYYAGTIEAIVVYSRCIKSIRCGNVAQGGEFNPNLVC